MWASLSPPQLRRRMLLAGSAYPAHLPARIGDLPRRLQPVLWPPQELGPGLALHPPSLPWHPLFLAPMLELVLARLPEPVQLPRGQLALEQGLAEGQLDPWRGQPSGPELAPLVPELPERVRPEPPLAQGPPVRPCPIDSPFLTGRSGSVVL